VEGAAAVAVLAAGMLAGCGTRADRTAGGAADSAYVAAIESWHAERAASLREPDGWFSLAGLFWLVPGENPFGAAESNRLVFPEGKAPARAGSFVRQGDAVTLRVRPGVPVTCGGRPVTRMALRADADSGGPSGLALGPLRFHVIRRGGRVGVRLKDLESPERARFTGLEYYAVDPGWRLRARFEPYDPPKPVAITNVLGDVSESESPGAVVFERGGRTYRLDPILEEGSDELFLIFADSTNGRGTYGAGRFLYAKPPGPDGILELDFNRAYNPPCAFTPFATCPLPPPQNRLPLAIAAGEKDYRGGAHR
jgi:hypothetical protein